MLARRWTGRARRLLGHRVTQFLAIAAVLLAVAPAARDERVIDLRGRRIDALAPQEAAQLGLAAPTAALVARVTAQAVEDELLVLAEDLGGASRPVSEREPFVRGLGDGHERRVTARTRAGGRSGPRRASCCRPGKRTGTARLPQHRTPRPGFGMQAGQPAAGADES